MTIKKDLIFVSLGSQKEKKIRVELKKIDEVMAESFLDLAKDTNLQIQEVKQTRNRISSNKPI